MNRFHIVIAAVGLLMTVQAKEFVQELVPGEVHASSFIKLRPDGYVAVWFEGTREGRGDVAICGARRIGGKWEKTRVFADVNKDSPHWNPVLRRADDGRICLYFKVGLGDEWRTYISESTDEAKTWSEPRELIAGECRGGRGPVRNKCLRLKSGRWLAPASREIGPWRAFVDRSDDDGRTWTDSAPIGMKDCGEKDGLIQPTLWIDDSGAIRAYMRSNTGKIWESVSRDDGVTWEDAKPTKLPNNNSGIDAVRVTNGDLYLVLNPTSGNWASRSILEIWKSKDCGNTWEVFRTLEKEESGEFSYPCIREVAPGMIAVSYTWRRKRIAFDEISVD